MDDFEKTIPTLTIKQVSQRLNITRPTLRYWEKEMDGLLVPLRTPGGQRRYTLKHLFMIEEIRRLKEKGLSLVNIKNTLNHKYHSETGNSNVDRIDLLADQISEIVKSAIYSFFEKENF